jgi:HEAT repeat protein
MFAVKRFNKLPKTEPVVVPGSPVKTNTGSAMVIIEHMGDFIDTPYSNMTTAPEPGSPGYLALHQTLLYCLTNEDSMDLRFEAARVLVLIKGHLNLSRFDGINLRSVLNEMMREGDSYRAFFAGCILCELNWADAKTFRRVKRGLGDLNENKRQMAMTTFASLGQKHAVTVLELLIAEAENTSWRVRVDVVSLLETWIMRVPISNESISSDNPPPGSSIDPSGGLQSDEDRCHRPLAGSLLLPGGPSDGGNLHRVGSSIRVDGNELLAYDKAIKKSSFSLAAANVGAGHLMINNSAGPTLTGGNHGRSLGSEFQSTATIKKLQKEKILSNSEWHLRQASRLETLVDKALEVLLTLMWNDWAAEVRTAATNALSRLGKGRPVFEWIIGLLESPDPARRIDALKCLSQLGFLTPTAMESFLVAFKDPYSSVRIEACKVKIKSYIKINTLSEVLLLRSRVSWWKITEPLSILCWIA